MHVLEYTDRLAFYTEWKRLTGAFHLTHGVI